MAVSTSRPARIAIMTFTYEGDREIAFDMLESLVSSCRGAELELFITDDGSPSNVGAQVTRWAEARGIRAVCLRNEENQGFRGAVDRTMRLLRTIAIEPTEYDVILRIDTDALVVREGIDAALQAACTDPVGLYGVFRFMRGRDRVGFGFDLLPLGLKRRSRNGRIEHTYELRRTHPVWWWKIGLLGLARGFDFGFVAGSCYVLGGRLPRALLASGYLDQYDPERYGLLTSEEDIIITLMCRAARLPIYHLDDLDPTWRDMNTIGAAILERAVHDAPFVIHALKPTPEGAALRDQIKAKMPLFRAPQGP